MTPRSHCSILTLGILISGIPFSAFSKPCCCASAPASVPTTALTEAEARDLLLMREEEKLARDVYNAMHELYDQRVFVNIPRAEQWHMDAILELLKVYTLDDPARKEPGKFNNQELQKLYDELVTQGTKSRKEAFRIGARVEEVDIQDLQEAMQRTKKEDFLSVYENLLGGSKRHLNAFVRNYEAVSGKTYTAQILPQAQVDSMLGRQLK